MGRCITRKVRFLCGQEFPPVLNGGAGKDFDRKERSSDDCIPLVRLKLVLRQESLMDDYHFQLPELSSQYMTPGGPFSTSVVPRARVIRRSVDSLKFEPINHIDRLNVPDETIAQIFKNLNIVDLVNSMQTCRRFYKIGTKPEYWKHLNLSNVTIGQSALHRLLERKNKVICLYSASLFCDEILPPPDAPIFTHLTFLDLSCAVYDDPETLCNLLKRTRNLVFLNIAQFTAINEEICRSIAKNKHLKFLNVEMCGRFGVAGISSIFDSCTKLLELNMGWAKFHSGALEVVCRKMPKTLKRLNLAGMEQSQLTDILVKVIADRCPELVEIDLSDCSEVTSVGLQALNSLKKLKKLSLCRCYGVEPIYFMNLGRLETLNIHGCVTDDGIEFLRLRLDPTQVNSTPFSHIARPTFGSFERTENR